jgi:hypothetical protein
MRTTVVCLFDPKTLLTRTPSDHDAHKFTWFYFAVRHRPFFLSLFCCLPSPFLTSNIVFSFLPLADLVCDNQRYPRYVYIRAHVFVDDGDDEQTTTLRETVPQNLRHLGSMNMTADMTLGGVTNRLIVHRSSFFLPTLFPQRLADHITGH